MQKKTNSARNVYNIKSLTIDDPLDRLQNMLAQTKLTP